MTQEQIDFVRDNMNIFTMSIRLTPTQTKMLFDTYNSITGENKKITSCGRCVKGVTNRILNEYNKTL
tara:strand:+ start:3054 stop:3254 length:201 start_codon:yes stop_codon:yes gene_type:complete